MRAAFDSFYDKYHKDLFQYVFYLVKDRTTTEDIVQDVYIKVLRSYDQFRGESSEKTWLFSIARHTTMDFFRKQQRSKQRITDFFNRNDQVEQVRDQTALPEEVIILNEELKGIYHLLDQCSFDQKNVLILRYLQSLSIRETADILSWSESKVKTTQHRAIKKLQKLMVAERGGGDGDG